MSQPPHPPLPPGWQAQWDPTANRHAFVETGTGRSQYNFPSANGPPPAVRRGHGVRASISGPITNTSPSHQRFHSISGGNFNPAQLGRIPSNGSLNGGPPSTGTALNGIGRGLPPPPQPFASAHHAPQPSASPVRIPSYTQQPPPQRIVTPLTSKPENGASASPGPPPPPTTGRAAPPAADPAAAPAPVPAPAPVVRGSRRQYAANTRQYIAGDLTGPPSASSNSPRRHGYSQSVSVSSSAGSSFFAPGDAGIPPLAAPFGGPSPGKAPAYGGGAPVAQIPAFGGGPAGAGQAGAGANLADQFGQMGLNGGAGKQVNDAETVNLMNLPLNPAELFELASPAINLPPTASFSQSEHRNADPSYQRCTLNAIPTSDSLLKKSKVPLALILTPYRTVKPGDTEVPVATDTVIARCRRCRTYINPYVTFIEGGQRWKCCMCNLSNEVPQMFDWNQEKNEPADRYLRPELNHSVVEFVAPTEYMIRPPQPPLYIFILDVSYSAVSSGMLATAARTLLESLDRLPNNDDRTKIAVIGVDSALHFYTLPEGEQGEAGVLVVGDLDDVFLPQPSEILVNLVEAKAATEGLLERMNDMYKNTNNVGHALGSALQAAFKLLSNVGGKVVALSATLPNLGPGALKNRDDSKALGTPKESALLHPATSWYKNFAIECSRSQISVDLWLFSSAYTDVATLSGLPRYTGGNTYFYPSFNASRSEDALKFAHEFGTVISDPTPFEAVIRVRASRGIRMSAFHGNFFVRSTDLLSLASVPMDQSYAIELQIDDPISLPFVVLQTAVLHTTAFGERRIRVITQALPTTSSLSEVYGSVDAIAVATLLANKAVEKTQVAKLEDARDLIMKTLVDILGTYKATMSSARGPTPQLVAAGNMRFLPLLALGLFKNLGLRQSTMIPSDMRAYAQCLLTTLPSQLLIPFIHPVFYSLHNMPKECGTIGDAGVILPAPLPLSSERLERHGLFLIEDGQNIFLWLGREAVPQLVKDVFDVANYADMRAGKWTLPELENAFSERVRAIVGKVREARRGPYYAHLYVVKEDGEASLRQWALSMLIEDRMDGLPSYQQWLVQIKEGVNGRNF